MSRENLHYFKGYDMVMCNLKEARAVLKYPPDNTEALAKELYEMLAVQTLIVTLGDKGAVAYDGKAFHYATPRKVDVVDVCGAGDNFFSMFCLCQITGQSLQDSLDHASLSASICVQKEGTCAVYPEEILSTITTPSGDDKICSLDEMLSIRDKAKQKGKKIVFTNGYFDLIHAGQIRFLENAKSHGDLLIVGINSDRSVKENKGPGRPIINQDERSHIISRLPFVDHVIIFDEMTPIKIIKYLEPDVLVKGGKHTIDEVIGKDLVESYGGEVKITPILGNNTEELIQSIKNENKR